VKRSSPGGRRRLSPSLDLTFHALSDPTRRAMLARMSEGELSVTELARPFSMSLPAISKHLGILERAELIVRERDGRFQRCRLKAASLSKAAEWIERYRPLWESQLDALGEYLEGSKTEGKGR
jgi:DNA-binding transcriptional ArsR family regulator